MKNPTYPTTVMHQQKLKIEKLMNELALIMDSFGYEIQIQFIKKPETFKTKQKWITTFTKMPFTSCQVWG